MNGAVVCMFSSYLSNTKEKKYQTINVITMNIENGVVYYNWYIKHKYGRFFTKDYAHVGKIRLETFEKTKVMKMNFIEDYCLTARLTIPKDTFVIYADNEIIGVQRCLDVKEYIQEKFDIEDMDKEDEDAE